MTKKTYLGSGWSFPPEFVKDLGVIMLSDEELVRQSLEILLSTNVGERFFRFDYGCFVKEYVFTKMDLSELTRLKDSIANSIMLHEPRVHVKEINFKKQDEKGILWIDICYAIKATNSRSNIVYPYYFQEGTNL